MKLGIRHFALAAVLLLAVSLTSCAPADSGVKTIGLASNEFGQYEPKEIRVNQGDRVRIVGDVETLVGGMDTIVIEGYGLEKRISPSDNVLEFTADKKGQFRVRCANEMGNAQLIVV